MPTSPYPESYGLRTGDPVHPGKNLIHEVRIMPNGISEKGAGPATFKSKSLETVGTYYPTTARPTVPLSTITIMPIRTSMESSCDGLAGGAVANGRPRLFRPRPPCTTSVTRKNTV